ncbi:MAG: peptidylprolyl isomerase [Candidatus Melainabacteria bacterium]|nr:peptidylprolyl isomerase [Candidatus Melainabacteria bacterium]
MQENSYFLRLWDEWSPLETALSQLEERHLLASVEMGIAKPLFLAKKLDEYGIYPDWSLAEQRMHAICKKHRLTTAEAFEQWLRRKHHTVESFRSDLAQKEALNRLKRVVIPDAAVQERFLSQKAGYDRVIFGAIMVTESALAQQLFVQLTEQHQDFYQLALSHSKGYNADQGGMIGPVTVLSLHPAFRERLLALTPGQVSSPFSVQPGKWLMTRLYRLEQMTLTQALSSKIRDQLFDQWLQRQMALATVSLEKRVNDCALPERAQVARLSQSDVSSKKAKHTWLQKILPTASR